MQLGYSRKDARLSKPLPCAQCGHDLIVPEWSEELGATRLRYLWACRACGYEFETTVFFASAVEAEAA